MSPRQWLRILTLLLAGFATGTAYAGDAAALHVFGFSPDGKRFAYEESGIEDGSGFSFDRIIIIDVPEATIAWTALARVTQDRAGEREFDQARVALRRGADLALQNDKLSGYRAHPVAQDSSVHPFDYLSDDVMWPACHDGKTRLYLPAKAGDARSSIEIVVPKSPFALGQIAVTMLRNGRRPVSLAPLPMPRGEPSTYASLAAAYVSPVEGSQKSVVAIINECHQGFEGPDRRFMATLATVPAP